MSALDLFEAYAAAFARGDRPDVASYLRRAGPDREELARLIDGFLRGAVPPPASEEALAALRARLATEPPLLALRKARRARVEEVVDFLLQRHGWAAAHRAKVKRYYQQLEGGLLDARHVALPVLETIALFLKASVSDFEGYRAPPAAPTPVFRRTADVAVESTAVAAGARGEQDEVDRVFTAGR